MVRVGVAGRVPGDIRFAQQEVGISRQFRQIGTGSGVSRVGHHGVAGFDSRNQRRDRMDRLPKPHLGAGDIDLVAGYDLGEVEDRMEYVSLASSDEGRQMLGGTLWHIYLDRHVPGWTVGEITIQAKQVRAVVDVDVADHDRRQRTRVHVAGESHEGAGAGVEPNGCRSIRQ